MSRATGRLRDRYSEKACSLASSARQHKTPVMGTDLTKHDFRSWIWGRSLVCNSLAGCAVAVFRRLDSRIKLGNDVGLDLGAIKS